MFEKTSRDTAACRRWPGPGGVPGLPGGSHRGPRAQAAPSVAPRAAGPQAAIGHALLFPDLAIARRRQGLDNDEAVALMAAMVENAGRARPR